MNDIGKILVIVGVVLIVMGLFFSIKVPFLGNLPGDFAIEKENFKLYIPIATSVALSLLISLLIWLIR